MSADGTAAVEQALTGWSVGTGETALCQQCKTALGEGSTVTVYAYRRAGEQPVSVTRLYCRGCDRRTVEHATCGYYEWLAEARLALTADVAHQSHYLTLCGIGILDERGPRTGDSR
ncbi:hypothetical protein [Halococcus sediminicola]|uniref:hypothetical protein n=1 Tax=Halococcus sediminicola TaxID=1264579 RepID=UPI0006786A57|nr:hypothetical protein [Halococcus sediminicola]